MAFNQKEQEIIKYGLQNGKTKDEVQQAITNYRLGISKKPQQPNWFQETAQDIGQIQQEANIAAKERMGKAGESIEALKKGEQGVVRTGLQVVGQGAGYVSDVIGSLFKGAVKAVLLPQPAEEALKGGLISVASKVSENDLVKGIISKYNSLDLKSKRDIDAAIGVGSLALDIAGVGVGRKAAEVGIETGIKGGAKIIKGAEEIGEDIVSSTGKIIKKAGEKIGFGVKTPTQKALDAITPNIKQLSKDERQILLDEGKLIGETKLSPAKVILDPVEEASALKYKDLLQGNTNIDDSYNISNRITEESLSIEDYLGKTKLVYPTSKLKTQILNSVSKIKKPLLATESSWKKATTQLVDDFINSINKGKTIKGLPELKDLYQARKSFDVNIENALNAFEGTPTAKKQLAKAIRNTAQNFITDTLKEDTYKTTMKDIWELYNLKEVIDNKALKEMGNTGIQNWMKSNPVQAKIIRTTGGLLKLGGVLGVIK